MRRNFVVRPCVLSHAVIFVDNDLYVIENSLNEIYKALSL